ncbi:hypothetical protein Ait01nite_080090 [Actinoplanes italicus]|nr:hypothetical protein Ait01nite_080090 [Actinoplanes italicus]
MPARSAACRTVQARIRRRALIRSPMVRSGLADRDIAFSLRCQHTLFHRRGPAFHSCTGTSPTRIRPGRAALFPGMRETDGRWVRTRRRLAACVVVLAIITQALEAVNVMVTFVTNLG